MTSDASIASAARPGHRVIAAWLFTVAALVFAMVLVGGATRLTDSGLSITEWRPVTGAVPPLSAEAWEQEFAKYREIPEYQFQNHGMSLAEFQAIYWWEWGHRLLGRFIGIAFLLPFVFFLVKGWVERERLPRLIGLFVLGGAQGALGWFMVMSGLSERVDVSQYRLAAHLGLAFIIFSALFWTGLDYARGTWARGGGGAPGKWALGLTVLIFIQIIIGAFVAGLDAGYLYNTWPLMDGALIPSGLFAQSPWLSNFTENLLTVQFTHRMVAYTVVIATVAYWLWLRRQVVDDRARKAANMLLAMVGLQLLIGIWTLLAVVPLPLGLLHQAGAEMVLSGALYLCHRLWAR